MGLLLVPSSTIFPSRRSCLAPWPISLFSLSVRGLSVRVRPRISSTRTLRELQSTARWSVTTRASLSTFFPANCATFWSFSTYPLPFELPTGLPSTIVREPPFLDRKLLHDSIEHVKAGSLPASTMMSTNPSPISLYHAINLRQLHSPFYVLGAAMLDTAFAFSRAAKNAKVYPSFSSHMNM